MRRRFGPHLVFAARDMVHDSVASKRAYVPPTHVPTRIVRIAGPRAHNTSLPLFPDGAGTFSTRGFTRLYKQHEAKGQ